MGRPSSPAELGAALGEQAYLADRGLSTAMYLALSLGRPLLLEGEAGVGKTEAAKALAAVFGVELIRLQCYEGIDAGQALYEWDYARQLLHIRALSERAAADDRAVEELFGPRFLVERPLLRALRAGDRAVLLIDEVDRADDEFEAFLLEVFVEPRLPAPHVVAVGRSPLVEALATMAGAVGFDVTVYEREDGGGQEVDLVKAGAGPDSFVVVATMGRYDEDAVDAALACGARYVALVASERRAATVLAGVPEEDRARVHAPAGLDLGDLPHVEIAVAILAQIVAEKARSVPVVAVEQSETAIDPVCGMTVEVATAADRFDHEGVTYWFCATGCRRRFERDPAAYLVS